jgi:hypothetical protein
MKRSEYVWNGGRITGGCTARLPVRIIAAALLLGTAAAGLGAQERLEDGWLRFSLVGQAAGPQWGASSVLEAEQSLRPSRYGPEKALDGDPATSWVEGAAGGGIGERYVLALPAVPEALGFHNGYAKNRDLFLKNYRVKRLNVRVFAAVAVSGFATERMQFFDARPVSESRSIRLADTMAAQRVELPFSKEKIRAGMEEFRRSGELAAWDFPQAREMGLDGSENLPLTFRFILRLEIAEVYPGRKWEDTCIAELWPDYGSVAEVSISEDRRSLLVRSGGGEPIPTYADFGFVLTLAEVSRDGRWALIIKEPAYVQEGERVDSEYAVVHTPTGREMNRQLLGTEVLFGIEILPTGFSTEGERVFVEYEDLEKGESRRALCELY